MGSRVFDAAIVCAWPWVTGALLLVWFLLLAHQVVDAVSWVLRRRATALRRKLRPSSVQAANEAALCGCFDPTAHALGEPCQPQRKRPTVAP